MYIYVVYGMDFVTVHFTTVWCLCSDQCSELSARRTCLVRGGVVVCDVGFRTLLLLHVFDVRGMWYACNHAKY